MVTLGDGIDASASGTVTVNQGTGSITAGHTAIDAEGSGSVVVNNKGTLVGKTGDGIYASSNSSTVTVTSTGPSVSGGVDGDPRPGLQTVSITNTGGAVTGTSGDGIYGRSFSGSVSVASTGGSVTGGVDAIFAEALSGTVTVGTGPGFSITSVLGSSITTDAAITTRRPAPARPPS